MQIFQGFIRGLTLSVCCALLLQGQTAAAKPAMQPLGANIAETGSAYYRFQVKEFSSKDRQRQYRVWLGIPKNQTASKQPRPVLYMLDGNAAMSHLTEKQLQQLAGKEAPVLAAIGYATDLPFESASRSLDYTPADPATGKPASDPRNPERMSGGSEAFRDIVLNQIAPWIEQNVKTDPKKRALWGHSYGGLFVLDAVLNGEYFSHYYAASPSLIWSDSRMMQLVAQAELAHAPDKTLQLMEGDLKFSADAAPSSNFDAGGIEKIREILAQFDRKGAAAKMVIYPNLKHGEVFKASLLDVLKQEF